MIVNILSEGRVPLLVLLIFTTLCFITLPSVEGSRSEVYGGHVIYCVTGLKGCWLLRTEGLITHNKQSKVVLQSHNLLPWIRSSVVMY